MGRTEELTWVTFTFVTSVEMIGKRIIGYKRVFGGLKTNSILSENDPVVDKRKEVH